MAKVPWTSTSAWRRHLTKSSLEIRDMQASARLHAVADRPAWPMLILRTPKGWTGPKVVDGLPVEGTFRAHQVPLTEVRTNPEHLTQLEGWLRSYRPEELFDEGGCPVETICDFPPAGQSRMSANPHANGGLLLADLKLPDFCDYGVDVPSPGAAMHEATRVLGSFLRDTIRANPTTFRLFGPDETSSNRLQNVFEVTDRTWDAELLRGDDHLAPDGRVMEVLSEHQCQGWLEGYLLTGRHGLFNCYEAFIHIVDSMFNQHAKWLKSSAEVPWRRPIASLNYLLSSHVWRQDNNGFSIKTLDSSTTWSIRRPRSSASTFRRTRTASSRWPTIACAVGTTSTSSSPASNPSTIG